MIGYFYRPHNKGVIPIFELENQLSEMTDTFRNKSKTTLILGRDFNAGGIDWETGLVPDDPPNRHLKENSLRLFPKHDVLQQMQREPTSGQNLLDFVFCKKPSFVKVCISITGMTTVLF